jgi:hypothetical protein
MKTISNYWMSLIVFTLLALLLTASAGLGVVWMRQQIMRTAHNAKTLEQQVAQVERKSSYLLSKIAEVHSPEFLKARTQGVLVPPSKDHVVWAKLPHKAVTHIPAESARDPYSINFELAILATTTSR